MSARRLDLLEKLCDLLESLPPNRFSYRHFATSADIHACGTTACALGWATTLPETGLRLRTTPQGDADVVLATDDCVEDFDAAAFAFGLDLREAWSLFYPQELSVWVEGRSPGRWASAKEVSAWIRRHIDAWRAEVTP